MAFTSVTESIFFNISLYFSIKKCVKNENYVEKPAEDYETYEQRTGIFDMMVGTEPVQNRTIWQSFFGMFSPFEEESDNFPAISGEEIDTTSPYICDTVILATQQESIYAEILVQWMITFLFLFLMLFVSCFVVFFWSWKRISHRDNASSRKQYSRNYYSIKSSSQKMDDHSPSCSNTLEFEPVKSCDFDLNIPKVLRQSPVRLISGKFNTHPDTFKKTKTDFFLEQTVDKFLCELDKKIGIGTSLQEENPNFLTSVLTTNMAATGSPTTPVSSLGTPRVPRRSNSSMLRKARQSITSYPFGSNAPIDNSQSVWYEMEAINYKMKWTNKNYSTRNADITDIIEPKLKTVLQTFQSSCPIKPDQLTSAIFIVNYVMLLLEKELSVLISENGFRFLKFKPIGSMSKGTKIGKASHFDFLMLISCTRCTLDLAYHHGVSEDIFPGNVLITAHEVKQSFHQKKILKRAYVDESFHQIFSPVDTMANANELVERALSNIMARNKKLMDRIPFTVSRSTDPALTLVLNTRLLHGLGFGIPEIYIHLQPGIPLHLEDSLLLPNIYAIVPPHLQDVKYKPKNVSSQGLRIFRQPENLDKDLFWNLSYCDMESVYLSDWINKIEETGVQSCFHVCLSILKHLFSTNSRSSLLNRGEIESYYLETIMYFLLLESIPGNWTFENLPCRLSDAVHFLRSAVQSQWLPNFFVANPHLYKKCPIIRNIPFLDCSRQVNLLSSMSADSSRKTLLFIESRLIETGIAAALKDEYSSDMWEYEFFVFG